ncbi:hypothetical protein P7K49_023605 [Saguinus oedipus]|uniref:Uncharacterized protein n=1 Tax=Saguinus oedipus TaxID=9490 RepID=A0ABQ9UMW3_SAGOE|nr:hypothetical protein P7K49_023605 [Saguinus oedipus]
MCPRVPPPPTLPPPTPDRGYIRQAGERSCFSCLSVATAPFPITEEPKRPDPVRIPEAPIPETPQDHRQVFNTKAIDLLGSLLSTRCQRAKREEDLPKVHPAEVASRASGSLVSTKPFPS